MVVAGNAQKAETDDQHAGDGAALERDVEGLVDAGFGGLGGPDVGADGDEHADEAGEAGEEGADGEADSGLGAEGGKKGDEHDHADSGDDRVLALHVRAGTFLDGCCDLTHPVVALGEPQDPLGRDQAVGHCRRGAGQGEDYCILFHFKKSSRLIAFYIGCYIWKIYEIHGQKTLNSYMNYRRFVKVNCIGKRL